MNNQTAAIYTRVSTHSQAEQGTSLRSQEKACRKLAGDRGLSVSRVFAEDYPGDTLDRPELHDLREGIRQRKYDAVICYDTDRLSRTPVHTLLIAEECDKAGVTLYFHQTPTENTPAGQLPPIRSRMGCPA